MGLRLAYQTRPEPLQDCPTIFTLMLQNPSEGETRRGHRKSLVAEPLGCEAPGSANVAGLHLW